MQQKIYQFFRKDRIDQNEINELTKQSESLEELKPEQFVVLFFVFKSLRYNQNLKRF